MSSRTAETAETTDLAQLHRPRDRNALRAAAHELSSRGLTPRDIASALQLGEAAVRDLLGRRADVCTP